MCATILCEPDWFGLPKIGRVQVKYRTCRTEKRRAVIDRAYNLPETPPGRMSSGMVLPTVGTKSMLDLFSIGVTTLFFAGSWLLIKACRKL